MTALKIIGVTEVFGIDSEGKEFTKFNLAVRPAGLSRHEYSIHDVVSGKRIHSDSFDYEVCFDTRCEKASICFYPTDEKYSDAAARDSCSIDMPCSDISRLRSSLFGATLFISGIGMLSGEVSIISHTQAMLGAEEIKELAARGAFSYKRDCSFAIELPTNTAKEK